MTAAAHTRYTIADYVRLEEHANVKHEFLDGTVWAMAGGTPEHAAMASAIIASLGGPLRGRPCRIYTSDARVRVVASGLDTYPDVTVVCGRIELDLEDRNAITNPMVLFEITSPATEDYDRGEKLAHYERIPSLREVVIVSHRERRADLVRRLESGEWAVTTLTESGSLELPSLGAVVEMEDIYRDPLSG